jgi:two-component system OmpR family response regulator
MQAPIRILYAEDDPDIRQLVSMLLEFAGGFTLKACSSGLEALNEIDAFEPQLLLFDVMMPGMNGPDALSQIRKLEAYRDTPVIFMTAKVQPDEMQAYLDLGAVRVISKPFDPMTLVEEIQEAWNKKSVWYNIQWWKDLVQAKFSELKKSFSITIRAKVAEVRLSWNMLKTEPSDLATFEILHRQAHSPRRYLHNIWVWIHLHFSNKIELTLDQAQSQCLLYNNIE